MEAKTIHATAMDAIDEIFATMDSIDAFMKERANAERRLASGGLLSLEDDNTLTAMFDDLREEHTALATYVQAAADEIGAEIDFLEAEAADDAAGGAGGY